MLVFAWTHEMNFCVFSNKFFSFFTENAASSFSEIVLSQVLLVLKIGAGTKDLLAQVVAKQILMSLDVVIVGLQDFPN
jgi:hypothetical protein